MYLYNIKGPEYKFGRNWSFKSKVEVLHYHPDKRHSIEFYKNKIKFQLQSSIKTNGDAGHGAFGSNFECNSRLTGS